MPLPLPAPIRFPCTYPLSTPYPVTSPFGACDTTLRGPHKGIDFGCPMDTPVLACFDGVIVSQFPDKPGQKEGNCIELYDYKNDVRAGYFHLSRFHFPSQGQTVKVGDTIGYSGSTGNSTGPHLHFQINKISTGEVLEPIINGLV